MARRPSSKFKPAARRETVRRAKDRDVPHCEFHTYYDDRTGEEGRTGPCNAFCRLTAEINKGLPLTNFLLKLMGYGDADVKKADPKKAAKLYGINEEHAAGYIRLELQSRGLHHGHGQ